MEAAGNAKHQVIFRQISDNNPMNECMKILVLAICVFVITLVIMGCSSYGSDVREKELSTLPGKTIEQVLKDNTSKWMDIQGIEGTAIGLCNDQPCIKIFTSIQPEEIQTMIPAALEGYPVVIEYTGSIRPLNQ